MTRKAAIPTRSGIRSAGAALRRGKTRVIGTALAVLVAAATLPLPVHAQTCTAPDTLALVSGGPPLSFTTCGSEPPGLDLCNGQVTTVGPSHIFNVFVTQGSTYVLTLGGGAAGFVPRMYLVGGSTCQSGDCVTSTDSLSLHDQPTGPYLLYVTAEQDNAPGSCGGFSLSLTGEPASDVIFQNGFD